MKFSDEYIPSGATNPSGNKLSQDEVDLIVERLRQLGYM